MDWLYRPIMRVLLNSNYLTLDEHRALLMKAGFSDVEVHAHPSRGWMCAIGRAATIGRVVPFEQNAFMTTADVVARLAAHRTIGAAPREELEWLAARGSRAAPEPGRGDVRRRENRSKTCSSCSPAVSCFLSIAGLGVVTG